MEGVRFLVIAGNHDEFLEGGFKEGRDKYLAILPEELLGTSNSQLVVYGTWTRRGDVKPEEIIAYCQTHNIRLPSELTI